MPFPKKLVALAIAAAPMSAMATNGMNMEGYGPIATAMGGASMAYDNGTAAMMNNPATIGLMESTRLDLAVGVLGPDVTSKAPAMMGGMSANSDGDSYVMPAVGWVRRADRLSYGVGVFAQGGMGTDYDSDTWLAAMTGQDVRSELGVGRAMFPIAYNVNDRLTVGGSLDFVWGGLDLKMAMPIGDASCAVGAQPGGFGDFLCPNSQVLGTATVTAGLSAGIGGGVAAGYDTVAFNFSDSSDFTQEASGTGFGGKIGAVYRVNQQLTIGGSYHLKTAMGDWEGDAEMVMFDTDGANPSSPMPGSITIDNFQWPATMAIGMAFQANDRTLLVADVKRIQWSDVMKDFTMVFTPDGMPGESAEVVMFQDWDDQTVVSLGGSYDVTPAFTVRLGANLSSNPVPDDFVHPLFPAIIENHYTAGFGYAFGEANQVDFSLTYAPEVEVTNSNTGTEITHSQTSWQLMYSRAF